jgi:hypothetical protein
MTETMNIKEIEKKVYTLYHEDGIIDVFAGAWIVMFGLLAIYTERVWVAGMFPVYGLPLFVAGKKKITAPRIGVMKFGRTQLSKIEKVFFSVHAVVYSFGIIYYTRNTPSWDTFFQDYSLLFFGVIVTLFCIVVVWMLGVRRFYAYAVLTLVVSVGGYVIDTDVSYGVFPVMLGVLIVGVGLFILNQFVEKYPVHTE